MIFVNAKVCNGCGICMAVCPTGAISLYHNLACVDQDLCQGCAACLDACPQDAMLIKETKPIKTEVTNLVPLDETAISIASDQADSPSWRETIVSTLVWTGREIAPRLANLAVAYLENRMQFAPNNQNDQILSVSGWFSDTRNSTGRRRRQRRRQRQLR